MSALKPTTFSYIKEPSTAFIGLFPYRWDFIHASHCKPDESPAWHTESRYPLSDRAIEQGLELFGVRFGTETDYFVLDIDKGSIYHPRRDRFATGRILEALELLGLTDFVACTSSYSGGLHLYFPLPGKISTWQVAAVVQQLLLYKGLIVEDGLLEVFPNVKNYSTEEQGTALYKAHRLPLQEGSYLLNDGWEIQRTTSEEFCKLWQFAKLRNAINPAVFKRVLAQTQRGFHKLGYRGEKFFNDLNTEIEIGWTGRGQTNYLLGRITLRSYIFGHRIQGCAPLKGKKLVDEIVRVATRLPGYNQWCNHRHEIFQRAEEWGRCVENSRYYPYGTQKKLQEEPPDNPTPKSNGWNEFHKKRARERICFAIADLLNEERLPASARERFDILTQEYGFSGETLYHDYHIDLWHPNHLWRTPPDPPNSLSVSGGDSLGEATPQKIAKSLLDKSECNPNQNQHQRWFEGWVSNDLGCNPLSDEGSSHFDRRIDPPDG